MSGKVAVITGSGSGFGLEIARRMAAEGYRLAISGRNEAELERAKAELSKASETIAIKADVTRREECKKLMDACVAHYGGIDVLVNNAGIWDDRIDPEVVEGIMDTNVKGLEYCTGYAIRQMEAQDNGGLIVNISSTSGAYLRSGEPVYTSSKFAVTAYSAALYMRYREGKIKVICFCPGGMVTNLFHVKPGRMSPDFMDPKWVAGILMERIRSGSYGLTLLDRRDRMLRYSRDFKMEWSWDMQQRMD